ncbi:hypothetical protein [Nonomuraea longicatena]|uniref:Integral membrane protein n=1 Tax=Nonomuraea longicatena TaxID=83682 RepID=A0ABN1NPP3_9ACTN
MNACSKALVLVAGLTSLFATYWDDAWHTDIGRDDALIPPHLLLFGSVAVVGVAVAAWGLAELRRTGSLVAVLKRPPLLIAAAGGVCTLASAPVDAAWHAVFGRDAVLWSPPHMLTVFGTLALLGGVFAAGAQARWIPPVCAALLLGVAVTAVLEFETDVPQFDERLYLPVLLVAALYAAALARALTPSAYTISGGVLLYLLIRLAVTGVLTLLGHTAPDLPLAVAGLAVMDLRWKRPLHAYAAGAAGVALTSALASATGLSSVPPDAVLVVAAAVVAGALAVRMRFAALLLAPLALLAVPEQAVAHDPGQGRAIARAALTVTSDGRGTLTLAAQVREGCAGLRPARVVARRAGRALTGTLTPSGCTFAGTLRVPEHGLWFLYAEWRQGAETWLPVHADAAGTLTEVRDIYLPPTRTGGAGPAISGLLLYTLGLMLLWLTIRLARSGTARAR